MIAPFTFTGVPEKLSNSFKLLVEVNESKCYEQLVGTICTSILLSSRVVISLSSSLLAEVC
jgi:hypothetical protein